MDRIINWFLLIIIFVFDPLAIALVIAANFAFGRKEQEELTEEDREWLEAPLVEKEEEWDEDHAMDQVLNEMVEDMPEEEKVLEDEQPTTEEEPYKVYTGETSQLERLKSKLKEVQSSEQFSTWKKEQMVQDLKNQIKKIEQSEGKTYW